MPTTKNKTDSIARKYLYTDSKKKRYILSIQMFFDMAQVYQLLLFMGSMILVNMNQCIK